MDLGATVCTRNPDCGACPVRAGCVARKTGRIGELPAARPRKALPLKKATWFVYRDAGRVLLERRPSRGIWGGLWSFPESEDAALRVRSRRALKPIDHGFTHFRLRIQPFLCDVKSAPGALWVDLDDAVEAAVPAPVKKLLQDLQRNATQRCPPATIAGPRARGENRQMKNEGRGR
jgi:A/G-specific adenine glycosylase